MNQQATRIDELTRAYASLVEEGKAARARMEREKARVLEAERAQVAQALLEAVDGIERALVAAGDASGPLVEGVRLTLGALEKKVAELGAIRIVVMGQRFDPRLAEAVDLVAVADPSQDDMVVQELQAGYRIGDRVLRPARVRVGRLARA
jgi:molecular chaperone GrpE